MRRHWQRDRPMSRRHFLRASGAAGLALGLPAAAHAALDPRDFGATGDGVHDDTPALQRAIDRAAGGGRVRLPAGTWCSGTLRLRSGVTLVLTAGATLLMSPENADFLPVERLPYPTCSDVETSDFQHALLFGDDLRRAGIPGHPVEAIALQDVRIVAAGGGTPPTGPVPEAEAVYPQVTMFGDLPASVLYVRHARDVLLRNVSLESVAADPRPPLVNDDTSVRRLAR